MCSNQINKSDKTFFQTLGSSIANRTFFTKTSRVFCGDSAITINSGALSPSNYNVYECDCKSCEKISGRCRYQPASVYTICGAHVMLCTVGQARKFARERLLQRRFISSNEMIHIYMDGRELFNDLSNLCDYGSTKNLTVKVFGCLRGGNNDTDYLENMLRRLRPSDPCKLGMAVSGQYVNELLNKNCDSIKLIEDVIILLHGLFKAQGHGDMVLASVNFIKHCTGRSIVCDVLQKSIMAAVEAYFTPVKQAGNFAEAMDMFAKARSSPLVQHLHKFSIMVIGISIFDKIGMKVPVKDMKNISELAVTECKWQSVDFIYTVIESIHFICERGYQCVVMKSFQPLFHSGKSYEVWFDECKELQRLYKLINHFEQEGISEDEFSQRLDAVIEQGSAIKRVCSVIDKKTEHYADSLLSDMKLTRSLYRARNDASASRPEPFGVLLYGGSSVMKSELAMILYTHYAKIFNLPFDDSYRYVRNFYDDYWSGFKSSKWCVHLDDIAPFNPSAMTQPDPSISEMLQIVNTTAYVTNQAELEDKGKIAVRAKLVTASTNVEHLNADIYYCNALAIRRRLPLVVEVRIKPDYLTDNMVDSSKIPEVADGEYLNVWHITVKKIVGVQNDKTKKQYAKTEVVREFLDIYDFMEFFSKMAKAKANVMNKSKEDRERMAQTKVCLECYRPEMACLCPEPSIASQCDSQGSIEKSSIPLFVGSDVSDTFSVQNVESDCISDIHDEDESECPCPGDCICPTMDHVSRCETCTCTFQPVFILARTPSSYRVKMKNGPAISVHLDDVRKRGLKFEAILPHSEVITEESWNKDAIAEIETLDRVAHLMCNASGDHPWRSWIAGCSVSLYARHHWLQSAFRATAQYGLIRRFYIRCIFFLLPQPCRMSMLILGDIVAARYERHKLLIKISCVFAILGAMFYYLSPVKKEDEELSPLASDYTSNFGNAVIEDDCTRHIQEQVKIVKQDGVADVFPVLEQEFENQWDSHDIKLADRPVNSTQVSWKGLSDQQVCESLKHNLVTFRHVFEDARGVRVQRWNKGVCVGGHWYVTNYHGWAPKNCTETHIFFGGNSKGIEAKQLFNPHNLVVKRVGNTDVLFVQILGVPPRRDIRALFAEDGADVSATGLVLTRNHSTGDLRCVSVARMENIDSSVDAELNLSPLVHAFSSVKFDYGDCGSLWVSRSYGSTQIMGIHYWSAKIGSEIGAVRVTQQMIKQHLPDFLVSSNTPILKQAGKELQIGPLRKKSHVLYIDSGNAIVYGSSPGFRRAPKSTVRPSCIAQFCAEKGYCVKFGAPQMNWRSYHKALLDMTDINTGMSDVILEDCVKGFAENVRKYCDPILFPAIEVSQQVAINGQDGVAYVDAMNKKTSAGSPFRCSKRDYLIEQQDGSWTVTNEIQVVVDEYEARYARGERCVPLFATAQKDEPKALHKCADGARIFICSSLPWSIVVRKKLLWFIRLMQNNRLPFECAVGVSAQSSEWGTFRKFLMIFGDHRMVDGDYKAYDKKMGANVILKAFQFICKVCDFCGGSIELQRSIECIGNDVAFAFVDFDGDIIEFLGSNPSGHPLTVIINCIVGCLYMRYAFVRLTSKPVVEFPQWVKLLTYGDDNVFSVHPELDNFNHTTIQSVFASVGITYTMADKTAVSVPFQSMKDVSFLKRKWVMVDGRCMAPLEKESIIKMLTIHCVKKGMCERMQTTSAISSAVREAYFHGEDYFHEITDLCKQAVEAEGLDLYVKSATFPSYPELTQRWDENSAKLDRVYQSRGGVPGLDW